MVLDNFKGNLGIIMIISLILVCLLGVFIYKKSYEEGFGDFYDRQTAYTASQRAEFWDNMNLQVDYNEDLDKDIQTGLTDAIRSIDPLTNKTKKHDINSFFRKDALPGIIKDDRQCSNVSEPSLLPPHQKTTASGCGWWYQDDDYTLSIAAKGTVSGPFSDMNKSHPKGKWMWDLAAAQKLEDQKRCRRIKNCDMADMMGSKCGFCSVLGMGIPAGSNGKSKYADDATASCPEPLIMKPANCPKTIITPLPVTLPDGKIVIPAPPPGICDPLNGRLTNDCLISLAKGVGCNDSGAIVTILAGDPFGYQGKSGEPAFKYKKAVEILGQDGPLKIQDPYIGKGVCERGDALDFYQHLVSLVLRGKTTRVRDASAFLALGNDFDPCDYELTETGPFDAYCLERVAREAGCQPDGTDFPSKGDNKKRYDKMTWQKVNDSFANIHGNLLSKDQLVLADASLRCLGINIVPKVSECGDRSGVEVLWYSWDYDYDMPERGKTAQIFYGREIKPNLPNFSTNKSDYNPYKITNKMSFRARTQMNSNKQRASRMWVMTGDGVAIKVDGRMVLKSWRDQGPTAYETDAYTLKDSGPTNYDIYWYRNFGMSTFLPKISNPDDLKTFIPILGSDLSLIVPDTFPLCRWDFYTGIMDERNNVLTSNPENMSAGVVDGKKCGILGNLSGIQIVNPIAGGAFKSFTFMTFHKGGWARLFALRMGQCDLNEWRGWSIEGGICADSRAWFCLQRKGGVKDIYLSTPPKTVPREKWTHIAFCIDDDFKGVTIYCDSKIIGKLRNERTNPFDYTITKYNIATIGHAGWKCSKTIQPPAEKNSAAPPNPPNEPLKCKGLGRPSPDGRLRHYTQSECDSLDGRFSGDGECSKKEGGSHSWDCRELNKYPTQSAGPQLISDCPPSKEGDLDICLAWVHWFDYTLTTVELKNDMTLVYTDETVYVEDNQSGWKKGKTPY